ncbi:MAG TPA: ERCC4 domain-containing protein [Azospirillaceae bacterium]|nr:ERCC4 domain-containing protein [Azospirillaceae bacterium]
MTGVRIIIDNREPPAMRGLLAAHREVELEVRPLSVANFVIGPDAAAERKTADDFVRSIMDGRFADQAARLAETYAKVLWLVEGDPFATGIGISRNALAGALSRLAVLRGTSVLHTDGKDQTAALIVAMARHLQGDGSGEVAPRHAKPEDPDRAAEFIVGGLPGIGARRARLLLSHFGSVAAVFRATDAEIAALPGFGKRTAANIRAALERRYGGARPGSQADGAGIRPASP